MFTRFNLKNSKGDAMLLIDQYSVLLATVYLKLGKSRKRSEFEEKFADTNEDFIDSKYHFSHYRDFLPLLKNYITNTPSKYKAKKYQTLFEYMKKTELDENEKKFLKDNKNDFFNDFFSIVESHHNAILNKIFFLIFWFGVFGTAISGLLIYIRIESKYPMNYLGIAFIGGSVLSLIVGSLSYFILHGKVKSIKVKSRFFINIKCCFQRLDELEMALRQQFKLVYNNNFKFDYDNIDDPTIPFVARIRKENSKLPLNIINVFQELGIFEFDRETKLFKTKNITDTVSFFMSKCPGIKSQEYSKYFSNIKHAHTVDNNSRLTRKRTYKGDDDIERESNQKKTEDFIKRILDECEKHKIVASDDKNAEK